MKSWIRIVVLFTAIWLLSLPFPNTMQAAPPDMMPLLLSAPWHGSYVCNQGLTRMQLTLRPLAGSDENRLEAEFVFSADPDNPSVPTGSFRLVGSLNPKSGLLVLKQDRWLEQPADPSYRMVDMEGRLIVGEAQAMIRGRMTSYGCQDFAVWQFFADATGSR